MLAAAKVWPEGFQITDDQEFEQFVLVTILAPDQIGEQRSLHFPKSRLRELVGLGVKTGNQTAC